MSTLARITIVTAGLALASAGPLAPGARAAADAKAAIERGRTATATLKDAQGAKVGLATLEETANGVLMIVDFERLPAGAHAVHVHEKGACQPPFESAGGHFNPGHKKHGILNEHGPHAGDLGNVFVPESGKLKVELRAPKATLAKDGAATLLDGDGAAIVVHAGRDDLRTDPAGNSGDRIACGVIELE